MIQCPLCQMINEDQTRFCAECGARLGPSPSAGPGPAPHQAPQAQQGMPPQAQQGMPPQAQQGVPPQAPQGRQPQQAMPQQGPGPGPGPGPRLNSPMLANAGSDQAPGGFGQPSNDPGEMDRLRRMNNRPQEAQQQQQQYAEAPQAPPAKPVKKLRSPLLESEDDDYPEDYPPQQQQGGGRGLRSPMLGAANAQPERGHDQGHAQGPSGRHHLHSPLLGGGDDDYYDDPNPAPARPGGLHSPMLGGGGAARPGGLRSPILGGAAQGSGGFEDYYEEDDYDPYADEDNPNILRSPLLSSKMNEEPRANPRQNAQAQPRDPNYPPSPQQGRPQQTPPQGGAFQAPQQQAAQPQAAAFHAPQQQGGFQAPQGQDPRAWDNTGHNQGQAPGQIGQEPPHAPSNPPQAPQMQPALDAFNEPKQGGSEEFPDMTQYRRRQEAQQAAAAAELASNPAIPPTTPSSQAPISQFNVSMDAGFIPPDPNETMAGAPHQASSYLPPAATTAAPPAKQELPGKPEAPAKLPKRSSSKLLGDAEPDDDYEDAFPAPGQRRSSHHQQMSPAQASGPGSPIPKMMGGIAILMAMVKVPALLPLVQALGDPRYAQYHQQYQAQALDLATTMIALVAVGLGLLMSKN